MCAKGDGLNPSRAKLPIKSEVDTNVPG